MLTAETRPKWAAKQRPKFPLPPTPDLVAELEAGATAKSLAAKYGCSKTTISVRTRDLRRNDRLPSGADLAAELRAGASRTQLAKKYGCARCTITARTAGHNTGPAEAPQWQAGALCATGVIDPDAFFPEKDWASTEVGRSNMADALALCAACPIREMCLQQSGRHMGIWAGMGERARKDRLARINRGED